MYVHVYMGVGFVIGMKKMQPVLHQCQRLQGNFPHQRQRRAVLSARRFVPRYPFIPAAFPIYQNVWRLHLDPIPGAADKNKTNQ